MSAEIVTSINKAPPNTNDKTKMLISTEFIHHVYGPMTDTLSCELRN